MDVGAGAGVGAEAEGEQLGAGAEAEAGAGAWASVAAQEAALSSLHCSLVVCRAADRAEGTGAGLVCCTQAVVGIVVVVCTQLARLGTHQVADQGKRQLGSRGMSCRRE